jgi:hypothetical protein
MVLPWPVARSLSGVAQCRLELGEGLFGPVEVRMAGRQIDELCAAR